MGMPLEVTDDFEFDEMNISAVCEVMNQMMGSSATALSEIIDTAVDISTPEAIVQDSHSAPISKMYEDDPEDNVCVVKFNLTIDGVINSEFMSVLTIELAKEMAKKMLDGYNSDLNTAVESSAAEVKQEKPANTPVSAPASSGAALSQDQMNAMLGMGTSQQPVPQQNTAPVYQAPPPQYAPQQPYPDPAIYGMPAGGYPGYPQQQPYPQQAPQYGYPQQQQVQRGINVQAVQFQNFETYQNASLSRDQNDNLKLLMNVPLNVTVEIGSAKKKVKDILEFSQGTIIELERQAGSPVDVIVNGNLIAKGDVVVIDDNFAVRITEIVKSKFLDNLGKE